MSKIKVRITLSYIKITILMMLFMPTVSNDGGSLFMIRYKITQSFESYSYCYHRYHGSRLRFTISALKFSR